MSKVQGANSISKIGFALSKLPHLHRTYAVRGCLFNLVDCIQRIFHFHYRQRHDSDISPPRVKKEPDSDISPPRKVEKSDSDASPPRLPNIKKVK